MICVIWYFQSKRAICFEEKVKFIELYEQFAQIAGLLATKVFLLFFETMGGKRGKPD